MKRFVAGRNDAGQRLDKLLTKLLKSAPKSMIYKWIRKKRIKVNGKRQEIGYFVCEGDVLELYINDEFFAEKKEIPQYLSQCTCFAVVYEDENILIADKPSGMKAHDGDGSLLRQIQAYLYQKGDFDPISENTFAPALCNRIDRNTSGLVLAAKNAETLRIINEKLRTHEIRKFYLLRTEGTVSPSEGRIEGYTLKNEAEQKVYFYKNKVPNSKLSITLYRVLDSNGLVEAELVTGRTHQIRASFAAIGYPLAGDVKYGAQKNGGRDFQELRAYKMIFDFKTPAGVLEYLNGKTVKTQD